MSIPASYVLYKLRQETSLVPHFSRLEKEGFGSSVISTNPYISVLHELMQPFQSML